MGVRYRVRQFVRALTESRAPPDLGSFASLLTPEQLALFATMAPADQHHCLAVAKTLAEDGWTDSDLLRAALMHDVGKSLAHIGLWQRVVYVLVCRWAPGLLPRLSAWGSRGVTKGLYILAHHGELGAELAARAGLPERVASLVRGNGERDLQAALRWADGVN